MGVQIQPHNRYLWVEKTKEKESESEVLLPEGYQGKRGPEFVVVKVIDKCGSVGDHVVVGDSLVVRNHMIESIEVEGKTLHMILANHVVGELLGS